MDYQLFQNLISPLLIFGLGVLVAVIGYFIKKSYEGLEAKQEKAAEQAEKDMKDILKKLAAIEDESEARIGKLNTDLHEFKAVIPRHYVLKDDYIRTISAFEYKLDNMDKKSDRRSSEINKKIDDQFSDLRASIDMLVRRKNAES